MAVSETNSGDGRGGRRRNGEIGRLQWSNEAGEDCVSCGTPRALVIWARGGRWSSQTSLSSAQMADRGWARHGRGVCDAFKANHDEAAT